MKPDYPKIASLLEQLALEFWKLDPDYQIPKDLNAPKAPKPAPEPVKAKEIELSDLQALGRKIIQAGRQDDLKESLNTRGLKSLSSAPSSLYSELFDELTSISKRS
jgi:hypothetical protein